MLHTRFFFMNEFTRFIPDMKKYKHKVVSFSKGDYLKAPSQIFQYNYLILDGLCRVSVLHDSGSERVIGYWGKGSMYPIITKEQKFNLEDSIITRAMTKITALEFDVSTTKEIMREYPEISYEMIDHYCKYTNLYMYCLTTQTYEPLKTRVCSMIMIYYQNFGTHSLPITQNDLSSLVGAKRESVVKIIRELKSQKIIDTKNGYIQITSLDALSNYTSSLL